MMNKGGGCGCWMVAKILVLIGALNWGLVGIGGFVGGNWNVLNLLLGGLPTLEWIVYILVGIAGLVMLFGCKCRKCKGGDCGGCGNCRPCKEKMSGGDMGGEQKM